MRRRHHDEDSTEVDMTPMLDIVFIMLIFFIVTTSFTKESGLNLNRPTNSAQPEDKPKAPILIKITELDEIDVDGRIIDVGAVRANVERKRAENPDGAVVVQTHSDSSTDTVISVVNAAREAGVEKVSVAKAANE